MNLFSRFSLVNTVTTTTILMMILAIFAVAISVSMNISERIEQQAIDGQDASLRSLATLANKDLQNVEVTWQNGNVDRIVMESIPAEFESHAMIDSVGRMTGETATIFGWDAETRDFWRRTTNIVKPDGNRAVGTPLGQKGAVYAVIMKGETYRGEAVILGTPYYTIYKPVFSKSGDPIGIFYAGVKSEDINAQANAVYWAIGIAAVLAILAAAGTMWWLTSKALNPITNLTKLARQLANGNFDADIPYQDRTNEIGALANALNVFRLNEAEKKKLETENEKTREAHENDRRVSEDAIKEQSEKLNDAVKMIGDGLSRLSEGDLSVSINSPFIGELEKLRNDFNDATRVLNNTLANLSSEADEISTGADEMRAATDDLSRRTENQASSLEETSAALEELTATVKDSAARAEEASSLAKNTQNEAENSRKVVATAVEAMSRIEAASGEINSIINVIDEIAFQTNLLALNAGVEAARAGEAGRGFAVVAQEVRELAQRSAEAAKDIQGLITKSGTEVQGGVKLVNETGGVLAEISDKVNQISTLIENIATATKEQNIGLNDINSAVGNMDQVTQQNAAMAEEANAVMQGLEKNARKLSGIIGGFKFQEDDSHQTSTHRAA